MSAALNPAEFRPRRSALGFRCWDPLTDRFVTDGLRVSLSLSGSTRPAQAATSNANGYFGFHELFGLREYERDGAIPDPKPDWVLNITDPVGRFLPVCRVLSLPWQGGEPFLSSESDADLDAVIPGVMLLSAPGRRLPAGVELVSADLWDAGNERPAAFAQLSVEVDGVAHIGLADAAGRVIVPMAGLAPNDDGAWSADISARYAALATPYPSGSEVPDQAALLTQEPARLQSDVSGAPLESMTLALRQGHPLVLRTNDDNPDGPHAEANHRFWIQPAGA